MTASLQNEVEGLRRELRALQSRRASWRPGPGGVLLTLLLSSTLLLTAAVTIENADLEIFPNSVAGNPNDSYKLKLVGDGDTGADRAMSLHTVPTTDSEYRLAISDNGGTERISITDDGELGIGKTDPAYVLDVVGDARVGWNGNSTRIKILPSDFLTNNDNNDRPEAYENVGGNKGVIVNISSNELYVFVAIPTGYQATHVRIYGSSTDTVTVYETDIDDGVWSSSLGSAATGTEIDITDVTSNSTNYLVIEVSVDDTADLIYGGYVTITPA